MLGIWIVYDRSTSPTAAAERVSFFAVPVVNIAIGVLVAYALSMLAVAAPPDPGLAHAPCRGPPPDRVTNPPDLRGTPTPTLYLQIKQVLCTVGDPGLQRMLVEGGELHFFGPPDLRFRLPR